MNLSKPPPIVNVGPWHHPEAVQQTAPPTTEVPWWLSGVWDFVSGVFQVVWELVDVGEILFGFFRVIGHAVVVVLHAVFHL